MGNSVSLVDTTKSEGLKRDVARAIDLINFKPQDSLKTVVIKPNLCYYWSAASGYTTNPDLVGAIIDFLRETYGQRLDIKIAEADATAMKTIHAFPMLGYTKLAKEKGVELFNLSSGVSEEVKININEVALDFQVPRLLLDADLVINVPKLKIMREVTITCSCKNMFGAIAHPRKSIYHRNLSEAVVAINTILKPHLTIVEGLVALTSFPKKLNLIMAGTSAFSVDWIAAQIFGYDPAKIKFLQIATKEHLFNPKEIVVVGETVQDFATRMPKPISLKSKLVKRTQSGLLTIYSSLLGSAD